MQETNIRLDQINPVEVLGVNNENLKLIKSTFPKLKILARGHELIAYGTEADLREFEKRIGHVLSHVDKYQSISENELELILGSEKGGELASNPKAMEEIIVYGVSGKLIRARTVNQRKIVDAVNKNDLVFALGPAGTGKTYTAVALAVRALKNREVKRLMLCRPAVEAGEHLGFLPGDLKEKLDPYLQPLYDALTDMIPAERLASFIEKGVIQIAPLAFMRGRTLDDAFVILDEAQNATEPQMKMFLTRMGTNAKFIVTGDESQIDLPRSQPSGLKQAVRILSGVKGISLIRLDGRDVVRHKLVKKILTAYDKLKKDREEKAKQDE